MNHKRVTPSGGRPAKATRGIGHKPPASVLVTVALTRRGAGFVPEVQVRCPYECGPGCPDRWVYGAIEALLEYLEARDAGAKP